MTLETMPDNGVILVFCDTGSHRLELENLIAEEARRKNVKIFFAIFAGHPSGVNAKSLQVYERLSEGRIFRASSSGQLELSSKTFFDAVIRTVGI